MKITSLQISNILSFKYCDDIANAEEIIFDDGLNIIIGENGSGKSTALEVINFLFKRVLNKQYNVNQDLYTNRMRVGLDERRQVLTAVNSNSYTEFRLDRNWDSEDKEQIIRVKIKLDNIDTKNIQNLSDNIDKINRFIAPYTTRSAIGFNGNVNSYTLDISLQRDSNSFAVTFRDCSSDFGYEYLAHYNFYKEAIAIYNLENSRAPIASLYESFTLISSYRNYHAFERAVSLRELHPSQQIQNIRSQDFLKSLNASDNSEPAIFGLVRLRIAEKHFNLIAQKLDLAECEEEANKLAFIVDINKRLKVVNLECKIKLTDLRTWQYSFEFTDLRRHKLLTDINSLSAGQKAIIHLVFEAYGRGNLKGGLVIIDEPEIHLHYQFQHEYLQVVRELNKEQNCQYILVTHSEALINSSTISQVRRFSLNNNGNTEIRAPQLTAAQKVLIRILDNTRSTYAFFAKRVLLVEGDTDRYFFKAVMQNSYPAKDQEIAILHIGGKKNFEEWRELFDCFGLDVHFIADFDFVIDRFYPSEKGTGFKSSADVAAFKVKYPDWNKNIESDYSNQIYILKDGDLEHYLGTKKGLAETIDFCNKTLPSFIANDADSKSVEIRNIINQVTA